jgi:peptide/nickel transport system substrate-binding protein
MTEASGFGVTFLAFNTQKAPFDSADVRNAIYMALDLDSYQENLVKNAGTGSTPLPSSDALFTIESERWTEYVNGLEGHTYDPDAAKELLAQAGYADGFDCTLTVNDNSLRNSIALAMQEQLAAIGINLTINKVSTDEHTAYQFGDILDADGLRDYDMLMAGWESDFPDPSTNLETLYSIGNTANAAAYENEEVDSLIKAQKQSSDPTERNDLMFQAYDIITQDTPYVFLYYPTKHIAMNKAYTGVTMNASWTWNIHFQDVHPAE